MKRAVLPLLALMLQACSSTGLYSSQSQLERDPRYTYAQTLAQNQQLADALVQWRILAMVYPDTAEITQQLSTLQKQIEQTFNELKSQFSSLGTAQKNGKQGQHLLLKMLALQPDDEFAITTLRTYHSAVELAKAERKAQPLKKTTTQARISQDNNTDALNKLLASADEQQANQDFTQLLSTAQTIESIAPQHPRLRHYRYVAWMGLGQSQLEAHDLLRGLSAYENAIAYADDNQKTLLSDKVARLRQDESERLYTEAMKLFTNDIAQSIELLEQAISLDASNKRAQQQLQRAETIRKNLNLIKKGKRYR